MLVRWASAMGAPELNSCCIVTYMDRIYSTSTKLLEEGVNQTTHWRVKGEGVLNERENTAVHPTREQDCD